MQESEPMQGGQVPQGADWAARATLCEMLAFTFRYPTEELARALASGEYAEALAELCGRFGLACDVAALEGYAGTDPAALLHALRAEATRLFVGAPDPVASPYEGVWAANDDGLQPLLFVNPRSMAVERFMRSCGVGRPEGTNEPLDHVATELELLQYLACVEAGLMPPQGAAQFPEGAAAEYERFLAEHVRAWVPRLAAQVAQEAREPLYRAAAQALGEFATR